MGQSQPRRPTESWTRSRQISSAVFSVRTLRELEQAAHACGFTKPHAKGGAISCGDSTVGRYLPSECFPECIQRGDGEREGLFSAKLAEVKRERCGTAACCGYGHKHVAVISQQQLTATDARSAAGGLFVQVERRVGRLKRRGCEGRRCVQVCEALCEFGDSRCCVSLASGCSFRAC